MVSRVTFLAAGVALALSGGACTDKPTGPDSRVVGLSLPDAVTLTVGEHRQLQVHAVDARGRAIPGVIATLWSADPSVATVDAAGTVTAVAPGSTNLFASAQGFGGVFPLTVRSGEDLEPAEFHLLADSIKPDCWCTPYMRYLLDNWTLAPSTLPFVLRNAAGESLCGKVPVSISVSDSSVATAVYDPSAINPCTVRLTALANGLASMVVSAGNLKDSTFLIVSWAPARVFVDAPAHEDIWTAGAEHTFTFTALRPPATGLAPLPGVRIEYTIGDVADAEVTGPDGKASIRLHPTQSSQRTRNRDPYGSGMVEHIKPTRFEATADYGVHLREDHLVRPGPPDHIVVYEGPYNGYSAYVWCFWQEVAESASSYGGYICHGGVLVFVADAYGNPTDSLPAVRWMSGANPPSTVEAVENRLIHQFYGPNPVWPGLCSYSSFVERIEGPAWGRGLRVFPSGASDTFTATYPGIEPRTVTVTNRSIPPADPNDPGDFRNPHPC